MGWEVVREMEFVTTPRVDCREHRCTLQEPLAHRGVSSRRSSRRWNSATSSGTIITPCSGISGRRCCCTCCWVIKRLCIDNRTGSSASFACCARVSGTAFTFRALAKVYGITVGIPSMRAAEEQVYFPGLKPLWEEGQTSNAWVMCHQEGLWRGFREKWKKSAQTQIRKQYRKNSKTLGFFDNKNWLQNPMAGHKINKMLVFIIYC